eukprot:1141884-Pelagomonas_calceolata.AAC.3
MEMQPCFFHHEACPCCSTVWSSTVEAAPGGPTDNSVQRSGAPGGGAALIPAMRPNEAAVAGAA